ncbi:MAG: YggT family protein [Anaerolineales bacterium]|nr:YggT family protein [Anaerolineales bacterium]MCX7756422.1 YggT family protein [Anaerolineales bacterium]MDW8277751.1 YggT family protein [Anaerolineales bacterium]
MNLILAEAIRWFSQVIVILVLAHIILSYFLSPYHPIRAFVDRLVEPLLAPIRRVVPLVGMLDFSPMILIILVQLIAQVLVSLLFL